MIASLPSVLCFLLLTFAASGLGAVEDKTPVPLSGTMLLHGGGRIAPDTLKIFLDRGGNTGRVVVITTASDPATTTSQREAWSKRGLRKVSAFPLGDAALSKALETTAGVWIEGGAKLAPADEETARLLGDVIARGGAVGGSAPELITAFGDTLLPGVAITLEPEPGVLGYRIDEHTAAAIIGRTVVVSGTGSVQLGLAASKSGSLAPRRAKLTGRMRADHVAWRRAALARDSDDFPPAAAPSFEMPGKGSIVIMGGGKVPRRGLEAFLFAAGGKDARIAVINTALGDPPPQTAADLGAFDTVGATDTHLLHASTRAEAGSAKFIAEIDRAGGVWFTGGRQYLLVDRYLGTEFDAAVRRVLARGGAVGGTSAGATICGDYLVRGDPLTNRTMMAEGYERGFGLLPGLAIDQHFNTRGRLKDLILLKRRHPQLLALGIDEATAAVIQGTTLRVVGLGKITVLDRPIPPNPPRAGDHFTVLNRGDRFDLKEREVIFRWPVQTP